MQCYKYSIQRDAVLRDRLWGEVEEVVYVNSFIGHWSDWPSQASRRETQRTRAPTNSSVTGTRGCGGAVDVMLIGLEYVWLEYVNGGLLDGRQA